MSNRKVNAILIFLASLSVIIGDFDSTFRYVKYGVFVFNSIVLAGFLVSGQKKLKLNAPDIEIFKGQGIFLLSLFLFTVLQLFQYSLNSRFTDEYLLIFIPVMYAFAILLSDSSNKQYFIDILFYTFSIYFFVRNFNHLSIENILQTSFRESYSIFEASIASLYLWLFAYYLFAGRGKLKAAILFLIVLSTFKRLNLIAAVLLLLIRLFLPGKIHARAGSGMRALALALLPVLLWVNYVIYRPEFFNYFLDTFHFSLNHFMMGRYEVTRYLLEHVNDIPRGFGGVNAFLSGAGFSSFPVFHNDILKIYIELGIVGFLITYYGMIRMARSRISLILIVLFMGLLMFDHLLDYSFNYMVFILIVSELNKQTNPEETPDAERRRMECKTSRKMDESAFSI